MDVYIFLIVIHLIGTILGVGGATMIEIAFNESLKDGVINDDEKAILSPTYTVVRFGALIAVLSGFGFILLYQISGQTFRLYDPVLWAKIVIVIILLLNALLLQGRKISLYWGSALSFVSWWTAAILGIFLTNRVQMSFFTIMIIYTVAVVVGAAILHHIRNYLAKKT